MAAWLLALLAAVASIFSFKQAGDIDYVGDVAAQAAYASLLQSSGPAKPKVPTKDCTTCNGTGRIRSGDDLEWLKCPDCDPALSADVNPPEAAQSLVPEVPLPTGPAPTVMKYPPESLKVPKSDQQRYVPATPIPTSKIVH